MSEKQKKWVMINGFAFADVAEAKQAQKEADGVRYMQEKMDMEQPQMVLQIYNKMIRQRLFETAVGFSYLKELQEYLQTTPFVNNEDILPIPVLHPVLEEGYKQRYATEKKQTKQPAKVVNADYRRRYQVSAFFCTILAICVVVMFAITATAGNATILNYETQLINRYSEWEQELSEREAVLNEREQNVQGEMTE